MLAREKPHWGVSGVPFMKSTTGAEATAFSMAWRVVSESRRVWKAERKGAGRMAAADRMAMGRAPCRKPCWCSGRSVGIQWRRACI